MIRTPLTRRLLISGMAAATATWRREPLLARQTPESSSETGVLFAVTFSREWQPENAAQGAFYRIILEPGQSLTYLPGPYCGCSGETIKSGTAAERVMSGRYDIELDRPIQIQRPDGSEDSIDAGTEVELTDGDVAIYPDALAFGALRNTGNEPLTLFGASITSIDREQGTFTPDLPEETSVRLSVATWDAWQTLGGGDITAILTRRVITAGTSLDPYEISGLEAIHVQSGELHASLIRPGEDAPTADPRYISTGGTVAFRKQTPGTRRLLDNPFDVDATLIALTFTPVQ